MPKAYEKDPTIDEHDVLEALRQAAMLWGSIQVLDPFAAMTTSEQEMLRAAAHALDLVALSSQRFRRMLDDNHSDGWDSEHEDGSTEREKELRDKHPLAFKLIDEQAELARREAAAKQINELEQEAIKLRWEIEKAKLELAKQHEQLGELGMRQIELASAEAES